MAAPARPPKLRLLVFGASLRSGSLNHRLAELAAKCVEAKGATADLVQMSEFNVPPYDQDLELSNGIPEGAHALQKRLTGTDAFILASPEYNSSMPGVLKNLIDWASRFRPQPFDASHGLLLSASPSLGGGNRGLWSLRIPLEHLGCRVFPDMFSLAMAHKAFNADGTLADPALQLRFERNIQAFLELAEAAKHYPAMHRAWVEFLGEPPGVGADRVDPPPS